jgi:hypothetical protein
MPEDLVLIDTSAWIEALRPAGNAQVRERVSAVLAELRGATTPMVVMELLTGARTDDQYRDLSEDLAALPMLPIDATIWAQASRIGFELRRAGLSIPPTDILIAAVAIANHAVVLHVDRHFDLIASKTNLTVESLAGVAATR